MSDPDFEPAYRALIPGGELERRAMALEAMLTCCDLCPRACRVGRRRERGECHTGCAPVVASWNAHFGEEPPLSGTRGSGTIFLANCNLRCAFCQNADISQAPGDFIGCESTCEELAAVMLRLQTMACHNINWVSPTHQLPMLVRALALAAGHGLRLPIVYNTNAYDALPALRLLDGVVDIYLPDLKYADDGTAHALSSIAGYVPAARAAIAEMYRQVGAAWRCASDGTLQRGLFVRILVLPGALAGAVESVRWLAQEVSPRVAVSLMSQYRPCHRAHALPRFPDLARGLAAPEYREAVDALARWNESPDSYLQPHFGLAR